MAHLIQWFSSTSVNELHPSTPFIDLSNPIVENKFKQVRSAPKRRFGDIYQHRIDSDSTDSRVHARSNEVLDAILRKVRIASTIVSSYCIRILSFSHVEHIINEVIHLFSLGSVTPESNGGRILPLHFVALLDRDANWFRTWMVSDSSLRFASLRRFLLRQHATYSRAYVIRALTNNRNLVSSIGARLRSPASS